MPRLFFCFLFIGYALSHGYLANPAGRNALYQCGFQEAQPVNYDLAAQSAGGPNVVRANGLGWGVCGDPVTGLQNHVEGGLYASNNIIAGSYKPNEPFTMQAVVTAFHYGHFEFRLCVIGVGSENWDTQVTQDCFENGYLLERTDGKGYKWNITTGSTGLYTMSYMMPDIECERCVIQWYYQTANSGCSRNTEEFWNCADIKVKSSVSSPGPTVAPQCVSFPEQADPDATGCDCPRYYNGVDDPEPCTDGGSSQVIVATATPGSWISFYYSGETNFPPPGDYSNNVGPCDNRSHEALSVGRGDEYTIHWPRNNHAGGLVRISWQEASNTEVWGPSSAQAYVCYEAGCPVNSQCIGGENDACIPCSVTLTVPTHLADGSYMVQWVYYGGGDSNGDEYFSCVGFIVGGGVAQTSQADPIFIPGDNTYTSSCWLCPDCDDSYQGGPDLDELLTFNTNDATNQTGGTYVVGGCEDAEGIFCLADCSDKYYWCKDGIQLDIQPMAPGTKCLNNEFRTVAANGPECDGVIPDEPETTDQEPDQPQDEPQEATQGQQLQSTCSTDGIFCYPSNCCPSFYQCANGVKYQTQTVAPGTLCKDGQLVLEGTCTTECTDGTTNNPTGTNVPVAYCGNGICETSQIGENSVTCPEDCEETVETCGDNVCSDPETCATCQYDCGVCEPVEPSTNTTSTSPEPGTKKMIGYYTNWAQYRSAENARYRFVPEQIDASLYTHLCFAFAYFDNTYQLIPTEWNDLEGASGGMINRFNQHVKGQNPSAKTLISIGGWNFNAMSGTSSLFTTMVENSESRATFIESCINWCRTYNFDGVDLDWEYPGVASQGGRPQDKANFVSLLREFRDAIEAEDVPPGKEKLLLSIAVGVADSTVQVAYDIPNIYPEVDWVGLMTYDLAGSWNPTVGAHTALYGSPSVDSAVRTWTDAGTPGDKLIVGVASYGRTWTLTNPNDYAIGASASGAGPAFPHTMAAGFAAYFEITGGYYPFIEVDDEVSRTVYAHADTVWVCYDSEISITYKVDYVFSEGLAGTMLWAVDLDDFLNGNPLATAVAERNYLATSELLNLGGDGGRRGSSVDIIDMAEQIADELDLTPAQIRYFSGEDKRGTTSSGSFQIVESRDSDRRIDEILKDVCENGDINKANPDNCEEIEASSASCTSSFVFADLL